MPVLKLDISSPGIEPGDWKPALVSAKRPTADAYGSTFKKLAEEREAEEGNLKAVPVLLSAICKIMLAPGKEDGPFVPWLSGSSGRTPLPEDLSEPELGAVARILSQTDDPELAARLADILWLQTQDHEKAQQAVDSYIASAERLEDEEEYTHVPVRLERALGLAALFGGRQGDRAKQVLDKIASLVQRRSERGITAKTLDLLDILLDRGHGDATEWAEVAEGLAEDLDEQEKYHPAIMFWERAIRAHEKAGNAERKRNAQICEAETYVTLADENASQMAKANFIRRAFEAYRHIPDSDARQEELKRRLLDHQKQATGEMGQISTEIELKDFPEQARDAVRDQDLIQALYSLALIEPPLDPEQLRGQAQSDGSQLQFILPRERVNALGRVVGTKPSGIDDPEGALKSMVHEETNRIHQLTVTALINPARLQILRDHPTVRVKDFKPLTRHNALIPSGRELQFARGLHAGLEGDFLVATHLLTPQVENSLRVTLQRMGVITSGLDTASKRQNEQSLNVTLCEYEEQLTAVFGRDTVFELKNLLIEPWGSNLRNEAMHGLMDDGAFYSHPTVYFWWVVLRICCLGNQGPLPEGFERTQPGSGQPKGDSTSSDEDT